MDKDLLKDFKKQSSLESEFSRMAEVILQESLKKFRLERLRKEIDNVLSRRDREEFMRLTSELNKLMKRKN